MEEPIKIERTEHEYEESTMTVMVSNLERYWSWEQQKLALEFYLTPLLALKRV